MAENDNLSNSFDDLFNSISENAAKMRLDASRSDSEIINLLKSINSSIKTLSQSQLSDSRESNFDSRSTSSSNVGNSKLSRGSTAKLAETLLDDVLSGVEDGLSEALNLDEFQKQVKSALEGISAEFEGDIKDFPAQIGKSLTKNAMDAVKSTNFGEKLFDSISSSQAKYLEISKKQLTNAAKKLKGQSVNDQPFSWITESLGDSKIATKLKSTKLGSAVSQKAAKAGAAIKGTKVGSVVSGMAAKLGSKAAGSAAASAASGAAAGALGAMGGPAGIALTLLIDHTLGVLTNSLGMVLDGFKEYWNTLKSTADRDQAFRKKRTEAGLKRLQEDTEAIIKYPFEILEKAANAVYEAWDANLRLINQTQQYSKEDLQSLIGEFSSRLKSEGLASVISSADITSNLGKVLQSGLSGQAAEEFAYLATKLSAAIPTQDFFNYATAYASLAANAIKTGSSQTEAINYANAQLELFASNILYASRELSGGFTTGLSNASDIFQKAVEISTAAGVSNASNVAGVLTSVSAVVGSIAPDLASSIVDAVYNAAVGGNTSQIVALRSLAGINASNTEFLQAFTQEPQKIFSTLFKNLAQMQTMSPSNYMEVAEGLSNVFGISKEAFARVDFNYLAKAIDNMAVNESSLNDNLKLLASGQSTTTAEQLKMQQINQYMLEEGLSYVLDNEVARSVQQHMWQEQQTLALTQNEYAVNLKGAALNFLDSILNALSNLLKILGPFNPMARYNIAKTREEADLLDDTVKAVLEAGKIGAGNAQVLSNLTTYGKELKLTNSYLSMLQSVRLGAASTGFGHGSGAIGKSILAQLGTVATGSLATSNLKASSTSTEINLQRLQASFDRMESDIPKYLGTTASSTLNKAIESETQKILKYTRISNAQISTLASKYAAEYGMNVEQAESRAKWDLQRQAEYDAKVQAKAVVDAQAKSGKFGAFGYEAWTAASAKYGISDFGEAIKELGYTETELQKYFENLESQESARQTQERNQKEERFWEENQNLLHQLNINVHDVFDKSDVMGILWPGIDAYLNEIDHERLEKDINTRLDTLHLDVTSFKNLWSKTFNDYFISHTTYNEHLGNTYNKSLSAIKKAEKKSSEDAINALTEALTTNPIADLMDPTVQQNVLIAQILRVVQAIFQQNNTQGKLKLPDAIAALATGMTTTEIGSTGSSINTAAVSSTLSNTAQKVASKLG